MRLDEDMGYGGITVDADVVAAWPFGWLVDIVGSYYCHSGDDVATESMQGIAFVPATNFEAIVLLCDYGGMSETAPVKATLLGEMPPSGGGPADMPEHPYGDRLVELAYEAATCEKVFDDAEPFLSVIRSARDGSLGKHRGEPDYARIRDWASGHPSSESAMAGEWCVTVLLPVVELERFRNDLDAWLGEEFRGMPRVELGPVRDGLAEIVLRPRWK